MPANTRRPVLPLVIGLVLALTGLILYQPTVRRAVLDPVAEGLQPLRYLLSFASQAQLWRAAVIVLSTLLAVVAVRLIIRLSWSPSPPEPDLSKPMGRDPLEDIVRLLDGADRSPLKRERIGRLLTELLAHALATHRNTTVEEARRLLAIGQAEVDPEVQAFLSPQPPEPKRRHRGTYHRQIEHVLSVIEQLQQEA